MNGQNISNISIGSLTFASTTSRTADGGVFLDPETAVLPAGKAGTLSTRTSDTVGIITVDTGHGIVASDTVDLFWAAGVAYGFNVSGVTATTISIETGSGDVLPAATTAVVVTEQVVLNLDFDGDDAAMWAAQCDQRAHVQFTEEGDTSVAALELTANEAKFWASSTGVTNPLTGNAIGKIKASCGSSTTAGNLKFAALTDMTP